MNAARDLANTGTQGEASAYTKGAAPTHVRVRWVDEEGRRCTRVLAEIHTAADREADAIKVAALFNALPAIADLLDATKRHRLYGYATFEGTPWGQTPYCGQCGHSWPCDTARARDAVEAALRGES